jgi:hypothetical protein
LGGRRWQIDLLAQPLTIALGEQPDTEPPDTETPLPNAGTPEAG